MTSRRDFYDFPISSHVNRSAQAPGAIIKLPHLNCSLLVSKIRIYITTNRLQDHKIKIPAESHILHSQPLSSRPRSFSAVYISFRLSVTRNRSGSSESNLACSANCHCCQNGSSHPPPLEWNNGRNQVVDGDNWRRRIGNPGIFPASDSEAQPHPLP